MVACSGCGGGCSGKIQHAGGKYCVDCYLGLNPRAARSSPQAEMVLCLRGDRTDMEIMALDDQDVGEDAVELLFDSEAKMLGEFLEHCLMGGDMVVACYLNGKFQFSDDRRA